MSGESHFPRYYRMSNSWRLFFLLCGLPTLVAGIWLSLGLPGGNESIGAARWIAGAALGLPTVLFGGWSVLAPFRPALVLHQDALEFPGVFRSTLLPRARIVGRRVGYDGSTLLLVEKRPSGGERLRPFTLLFAPDPPLTAWLASLPDLDAPDLAASQRQLDADPRLGDTVEARRGALSRAAGAGRWLYVGMAGLLLWAIVFPRPYMPLMLLLVALPWCVLLVCHRWPAFYAADGSRMDPRFDLSYALFAPGMILGLRAIYDVQLVDTAEAVVPALVVLAAFLVALASIEPAYRRVGKLTVIAALMFPYAAGAVCVGNILFDDSEPTWHRVTVNAKRVTTGNKSPSNMLAIDRWPDAAVDEVEVPRSFFDATEPGDVVCVAVRGGAIGIRWYDVYSAGTCPDAGN